jgi:hypothetical protein
MLRLVSNAGDSVDVEEGVDRHWVDLSNRLEDLRAILYGPRVPGRMEALRDAEFYLKLELSDLREALVNEGVLNPEL